jgi:hypothetical protein
VRGSVAAIFFLLLLTGCGMWDSTRNTAGDTMFSTQLAIGSASYMDRCIDIMKRAYSSAHIEITNKRIGIGPNMDMAIVDVQGTRNDVSAGGRMPRDIAAQCRFESGVITDFHWTAGPLQ